MILIIGAGLSGLLTAYRLKSAGIPFKILEARSRIGGRIITIKDDSGASVEMGATWFNDAHQSLIDLLKEFDLNYFEQFMDGSVFYQPNFDGPTKEIQMPHQAPSYRISGGTSRLIDLLYEKLDSNDVLLNQTVHKIEFNENLVKVYADEIFEGTQVVLALPPKLWAKNITFKPKLPENLMNIASETYTWMEDSIKVALTYKTPFWQQQKRSGALFSNVGPMTELYDHCNHERSTYALCGFMSSSFKNLNAEDRKNAVLNQLNNSFGLKALDFTEYHECIWSKEEHTFTATETLLFPHQNNGNPIFRKSYFDDKLLISSAESAKNHAGYMDGAVSAGNSTAEKIMRSRAF